MACHRMPDNEQCVMHENGNERTNERMKKIKMKMEGKKRGKIKSGKRGTYSARSPICICELRADGSENAKKTHTHTHIWSDSSKKMVNRKPASCDCAWAEHEWNMTQHQHMHACVWRYCSPRNICQCLGGSELVATPSQLHTQTHIRASALKSIFVFVLVSQFPMLGTIRYGAGSINARHGIMFIRSYIFTMSKFGNCQYVWIVADAKFDQINCSKILSGSIFDSVGRHSAFSLFPSNQFSHPM